MTCRSKTGPVVMLDLEEKHMPTLRDAIFYVGIIVATVAAMLLGDYLGYKVGRWRFAAILGGIVLLGIVAFTIYAAIVLA